MIDEHGRVLLRNARLSFPTLATPKAFSVGQEEKYSCDLILPEDSEDYRDLLNEGIRLAKEKWGAKAPPIIEMIKQTKKLRAFGRGIERLRTDGTIYEGYEGMVYVGAKSKANNPPTLLNTNKTIMDDAGKLYGGCYVHAAVQPYIQDNQFGKAIRCDLLAVQFVKDGEPFGKGRTDATSMFDVIEGAPEPVDQVANYDW